MNKERIKLYSQVLLFYTLLVILWGAWVRISHSGDGCGDTWPLCQGQVIPNALQKKTWIEYTHRMMSGLYGLFVVYFYWIVRNFFPVGSNVRGYALLTLIFMITEALLGAKLVLFGLVGSNSGLFRTFAMSLHQTNSLLLMGSTAAFVFSFKNQQQTWYPKKIMESFFNENKFLLALILVAITGAWAALSTTLFPSLSLLSGFQEDFSQNSHFLLKIRLSHPILALSLIGFFVVSFYKKSLNEHIPTHLRKINFQTSVVGAIALVFGLLTLFFLSPTWMKLSHLALAHILWIMMVRQAVISLDSAKR